MLDSPLLCGQDLVQVLIAWTTRGTGSMHTTACMQEVDEEWRRTVLAFQQKIHAVAVKLLKAIFIGLGREASIIDEVHTPYCCCKAFLLDWKPPQMLRPWRKLRTWEQPAKLAEDIRMPHRPSTCHLRRTPALWVRLLTPCHNLKLQSPAMTKCTYNCADSCG